MSGSSPFDISSQLGVLGRYALSLTRDPSAAEDLVQDTLVSAIAKSESYDRARPVRGWLLSIMHNRFVSDRRKQAVRADKLQELDCPEKMPAQQEWAVYLKQVGSAFDALPENQRAALHLVVVEGLTYQDAATVLEVPVGTLMSRLARARAKLRNPKPNPDTGKPSHLHLVNSGTAS